MFKMNAVRLGSVHLPGEGQHGERARQEVRLHVHAAAGGVVRGPGQRVGAPHRYFGTIYRYSALALRDRPRRTVHYVDVAPLVSDSDE